jgi:hypothetical protein
MTNVLFVLYQTYILFGRIFNCVSRIFNSVNAVNSVNHKLKVRPIFFRNAEFCRRNAFDDVRK